MLMTITVYPCDIVAVWLGAACEVSIRFCNSGNIWFLSGMLLECVIPLVAAVALWGIRYIGTGCEQKAQPAEPEFLVMVSLW